MFLWRENSISNRMIWLFDYSARRYTLSKSSRIYTAFMPVFDYKCRGCGHQFEYLVRHSSPAAECPACGRQDLEQLISLCAVTSEASRAANLSAAHARAAVVRNEKQRQNHTHLHEHFEDAPTKKKTADASGKQT
jgi:putative FmdB family regulatory protein